MVETIIVSILHTVLLIFIFKWLSHTFLVLRNIIAPENRVKFSHHTTDLFGIITGVISFGIIHYFHLLFFYPILIVLFIILFVVTKVIYIVYKKLGKVGFEWSDMFERKGFS